MGLFKVLDLLGGVALFLYGMHVMGRGLTRLAGNKLQGLLEKLTASKIRALALGVAVTLLVQSSDATIVMAIGLVNSNIMGLLQALYVDVGANIGTTITAWILSLNGLDKGASASTIFYYLNPLSYLPLLAVVGVIFVVFIKNTKRYNIGSIMLGFVLIMYGMDVMKAAVRPLQDSANFSKFMLSLGNPFTAILFGILITVIIQSSSASIGMLQAFALLGLIDFKLAIPVILGCNIGTCVTSLISAVSANNDGKCVALTNFIYKIDGVVILGGAFYLVNLFYPLPFMLFPVTPVGIAIVHSTFNIINAALHFPFMYWLADMVKRCLPQKRVNTSLADMQMDTALKALDDRFLNTPAFAVQQSVQTALLMGNYAKSAMYKAVALIENYKEEEFVQVDKLEELTDNIEDALAQYTLKLSTHRMSDADNNYLTMVMQSLSYFEQIGDRALTIAKAAKEMHTKGLQFSAGALAELHVLEKAVFEIMERTFDVYKEQNAAKAKMVEPLEEVIDYLERKVKNRHVRRLQLGLCTIELGFIMNDITSSLERTSDHCSAIALSTVEANCNEFGAHAVALELKEENPSKFKELYLKWKDEYRLPAAEAMNVKKM